MTDSPEIDGRGWLAGFAAAIGAEPPTEHEIETLLELAGVAAHDSERIAAPIACWLIGRAGMDVDAALAAARAHAESRST